MSLVDALSAYRADEDREEHDRLRMIDFARRHADPFDRSIATGHFTGSGLVMSESGERVLLLHHLKLQRWLQPGGHGEPGESGGEEVAMREVLEETGLALRPHPRAPRPFDLDIHTIPARKTDSAHEHLDLRYLFVADPDAPLEEEKGSPEASGLDSRLRWFDVGDALLLDLDPGLERMIRKAERFLKSESATRVSGENPYS